jgi:hypothetical protein
MPAPVPKGSGCQRPTFALTSPSVRRTSWNISVWLRTAGL